MQLATMASHPTDKTSWPQIQPLPATLPAPARTLPAKFDLFGRFGAGSIADSRSGYALRVSPEWNFDDGHPETSAVQYAGRDAKGALAAAAARAGAKQLAPADWHGRRELQQTLVGLYRAGTAWMIAPLWYTPGTNDFQVYRPLAMSLATTSDARFTFRDDRLAAVVAADGFVANPAFAEAFTA
jgi:hypothetical protein